MPGSEVRPTTLELRIRLPPGRIARSACLATWNGPSTLTASTRAKTASSYSATGATSPKIPALANAMSSSPACAIAAATAAETVTSATAASAPSSSASACSPSASMSRQHHPRALGDEPARGRRADAAGGAGDERGLVLESAHGNLQTIKLDAI